MAKDDKYKNDVFVGVTQPVRVLFNPSLAEPRKVDDRSAPKFEITVGFPEDHDDYAEMYNTCIELAREKAKGWGVDPETIGDILELKFKSGDEEYAFYANHKNEKKRRDYPQLQGNILVKLRSKDPISVFDTRRRDKDGVPIKVTDKDEIKDTIYGGCYVSLRLTFGTYHRVDQNTREDIYGVSIYPEQVCFVSDGERTSKASKDSGQGFAQVQGAISDEDPTGGEE